MFSKKKEDKLLTSGPLTCFFVQAGFGTAFTYLTSGVFLSGLALLMGAGDVLVSYLSVIANICGVLILALSAFFERFASRKKLAIALTVLSRLVTVLIVAIPALVPGKARLWVFIPAVVAAFALQAQTTVVLNQWMLQFIEEKKSGRYISLRQTLTLIVTVILAMIGGWWMDFMGGEYRGFVILYGIAALMAACEIILLARTPDGPAYPVPQQSYRFWQFAKIVGKNKPFTGYVLYIAVFYLLLNIADSFTMVYMMKYLALPYQTVTGLYMIISLPQVLWLGIWGKISDRRGHAFVLKTSVWLFIGEMLFMAFAAPDSWHVFIPLAFLISSVANSGFVVSMFNRRYELMPEDNRILYDNFFTAAMGLGCLLGPMAGGAVKGLLENAKVSEKLLPFGEIRLLYLISTGGILALQLGYFYFEKKTEGKKNVGN